jgi:hypothetical protein
MEVLEEQKVHHLNNHLIHLKEMIVLETLVVSKFWRRRFILVAE